MKGLIHDKCELASSVQNASGSYGVMGYGLWFMSYERALWGVKERESVCVEEEEEKE